MSAANPPGRDPGLPLPIAFLITELGMGGAERSLVRIAAGLPREQFSPAVYSLASPPAESRSQLVRRLQEAEIPTHFVGVRHAWQLPAAVSRLRRWWREQRPRIVQAFLEHANVAGALAVGACPEARLFLGVRVADPRWTRRRALSWAAGRAAGVVCVSGSVAQHCRQRVGIDASRLRVIPNGVDLGEGVEPLPGAALGLPAGRRFVAAVGRLHAQKGFDWLLECLPPVLQRCSDCDLVLVGEGPERKRLERIAAAGGIRDRVHFAGWRADVPQVLAAATAFVLPSRWEGMPNALLEAMASGLPVVSTRVEGVGEILGPLVELQAVQFGDRAGLIERLCRLLGDAAAAAELGRSNRARAAAHFGWDRRIADYIQMYRAASGRGKGAFGGPA